MLILLIMLCIFRQDVDLPAFLDYEIWKASYMVSQEIPGPQHVFTDDHGMIDFVSDGKRTEQKDNYCYGEEIEVDKE